MLHDVYAALVTENGFGQNFLTDATGSEGNVIFMRVLLEALLVQPCNPTCKSPYLCYLFILKQHVADICGVVS